MAESYATVFGNIVADFTEFHEGAEGGRAKTLEVTLRRASHLVGSLVPPPSADPVPGRYVELGKDAELVVARHLWENPGYVVEERVLDATTKYAGSDALVDLVRGAMGS